MKAVKYWKMRPCISTSTASSRLSSLWGSLSLDLASNTPTASREE